MTTLEIRDLRKRFGDTQALDGMSFTVGDGELYGFVGSNGAGKSTTMRIALGVLEADSGEVLLNGIPLNDGSRRRIGYMPEERGLYSKEKILDQLVFLAKLHGVDGAAAKQRGTELLEELGLGERVNDKLDDLSLGNQQRVQLAASLIHDPDILILDEPFSGLDPVAVDVMSTMLTDRARGGVPVVFSRTSLTWSSASAIALALSLAAAWLPKAPSMSCAQAARSASRWARQLADGSRRAPSLSTPPPPTSSSKPTPSMMTSGFSTQHLLLETSTNSPALSPT